MNRKIIVSILTVFMVISGFSAHVFAQEPVNEELPVMESGEETPPEEDLTPGEEEGEPEQPPVESTETPEITPEPTPEPTPEATPEPTPEATPEITVTPEPEEPPKESEEPTVPSEGEENKEEPGVSETEVPEETPAPQETETPVFVVPEETPKPEEKIEEDDEEEEPEIVIEEEETSWNEVWLPPGNIIRSYEDTSGSDWTERPGLAEKLDSIFRGYIGVTDAAGNEVVAPLGSHAVLPGLTLWACSRMHTGQSCFIYALGIYYTLFGEDPYLYRDHSEVVLGLSGRTTLSKEILESAGLRHEPGAYVRTLGHSLIVLNYDDEGIDVVQGNVGGDGFICISQYTWEEFNAAIMLGGGTSIEVVYQPTNAYFNRTYPLEEDEDDREIIDATGWNFICGTNSYYIDRVLMMREEMERNLEIAEAEAEIAKMAKAIAAAADDRTETLSIFEQMGFDDDHAVYEIASEDKAPFTYAIGKDLYHDEGRDPYELIMITAADKEDPSSWARGYQKYNKKYHPGFFEKAAAMKTKLDEILAEESEEEKAAQKIYLIMADGAAGACANILAADLTHEINADEESTDRVFAYTFGAPPVSTTLYEEDAEHGVDPSLNNLLNFVNPDDLAVNLPETLFGYQFNGKRVELNHGSEDPAYLNFRSRFRNEHHRSYRPLSPDYDLMKTMNEEERRKIFAASVAMLRTPTPKTTLSALLNAVYGDIFKVLPEETVNTIIDGILNQDEEALTALREAQTLLDELTTDIYINDGQKTKDANLEVLQLVLNPEFLQDDPDIIEIYEKLLQVVAAADYLSADLLRYLSLFVSEDHAPMDLLNDTHHAETYRLWINSMYFGEHGWEGYEGDARLPDFASKNILTIGEACFKDAKIGGELDLMNIQAIAKNAFKGSSFESLILDHSNCAIYNGSFADMKNLKEVTLAEDLIFGLDTNDAVSPFADDTAIQKIVYTRSTAETAGEPLAARYRPETAAAGALRKIVYEEGVTRIPAANSSAENADLQVIIPEGTQIIEEEAFAGWNLKDIYLPDSIASIGDHAFDNNPDLILYALKDSYAEQFAEEHGIPCIALENSPANVAFEKHTARMEENSELKINVITDPDEIKDALRYESDDELIAKITKDGTIQAVSEGIVRIAVSFNDRTDICLVRVVRNTNPVQDDNPQAE